MAFTRAKNTLGDSPNKYSDLLKVSNSINNRGLDLVDTPPIESTRSLVDYLKGSDVTLIVIDTSRFGDNFTEHAKSHIIIAQNISKNLIIVHNKMDIEPSEELVIQSHITIQNTFKSARPPCNTRIWELEMGWNGDAGDIIAILSERIPQPSKICHDAKGIVVKPLRKIECHEKYIMWTISGECIEVGFLLKKGLRRNIYSVVSKYKYSVAIGDGVFFIDKKDNIIAIGEGV